MTKFTQYIINNYGDEGRVWLANLPNLIVQIANKYQLSELQAIEQLSINYVMTGYREKLPIILKLSINAEDLKREALALTILLSNSTPKIIIAEEGLLIMERVIPGITLKQYINNLSKENQQSTERIEICCEVIENIQKNAKLPVKHNFAHIEDQLAILNQEWQQIPPLYLTKARDLAAKLLKSLRQKQTPLVFLHGDLHYENIILSASVNSLNKQWFVIDPKGVIGYPINEVWATIMDDIEKDTAYIAQYFNFELAEVREWYFVHLILVSCWVEEDKGDAKTFLKYAAKAF